MIARALGRGLLGGAAIAGLLIVHVARREHRRDDDRIRNAQHFTEVEDHS